MDRWTDGGVNEQWEGKIEEGGVNGGRRKDDQELARVRPQK